MVKDMTPTELGAYLALLEASNLLQQRMSRQLKKDGNISPPHFEILGYVAKTPEGVRMSDLAARAVHSRSGTTYRVTQLERLGWVKRRGSADDERSVLVTVTPKGAALVSRVLPRYVELLRESFFDVLGEDGMVALTGLLSRVAVHLRAQDDDGATSPPECATPTKGRTRK
ncbi:MAG: winged helix-turn-helix transcriptional regulator [Labilithrix sp.]|nr:winged helix-turn-helix transcriptional regulator [Labilithrix sp.]